MSTTGAQADPLHPLMAAVFDRSLNVDEAAELRTRLADDDAALSRYVDLVTTHALLGWEHAEADAPQTLATIKPAAHPVAVNEGASALRFVSLGFAAAVALIAGAAIVYLVVVGQTNEPAAPIDTPQPVRTVMDGGTAHGINGPGTYTLNTGTTKFQLADGTDVELRNATEFTVHGPLATTLTRGTATFNCPPEAHGFTVTLPDGRRVVDRGTRFTVELADDGRAVVSVHEGRVELLPAAGDSVSDTPVSVTAAQRADWTDDHIAISAFTADPDGEALTIANASFESVTDAGAITGWLVTKDTYFIAESIGSADPVAAHDGERFLTANRDAGSLDTNPAQSTITQHLDLARFVDRVDAGTAAAVVRFAYSAKDGQDRATVSLTFRGVDGQPIAPPLATDELTNAPPVDTDWAIVELTGPIPVGARSVELSLTAVRTAGTRTNVSFDNVRAWVVASENAEGDTP